MIKKLYFIPFALGSILSVSANEYKFEDLKLNKVENTQNLYEPKEKLDNFIINAANYSTKFIPLLNSNTRSSDFSNVLINDGERLLVDAGFDFVNSSANNQIQKIPFFA